MYDYLIFYENCSVKIFSHNHHLNLIFHILEDSEWGYRFEIEIENEAVSEWWIQRLHEFIEFWTALNVFSKMKKEFGDAGLYFIRKDVNVHREVDVFNEISCYSDLVFFFGHFRSDGADYVTFDQRADEEHRWTIPELAYRARVDVVPNHEQNAVVEHNVVPLKQRFGIIIGTEIIHVNLWDPIVVVPF